MKHFSLAKPQEGGFDLPLEVLLPSSSQNTKIFFQKYHVTLYFKGERDGLIVSLEQSQDLVREARSELKEAGDRLVEEQKRCDKLRNERKEVRIYLLKYFLWMYNM